MEKQNALRAYGAEVVVCPTSAPPGSPDHYEERCHQIAAKIPGSFKSKFFPPMYVCVSFLLF